MGPVYPVVLFVFFVPTVAPAPPCVNPPPAKDSCYSKNCPPPSRCEMIVPPCGKKPVPTCVCPKGQVWSECPNCFVTCLDYVSNESCDLGCSRPPQCVCPPGQLLYKDACRPQEKCPPLE